MWQVLWLWFVGHQSDLQNLYKDLLELRSEIGKAVPNSDTALALQNKLTLTMQKIEQASVRADSIHGDLKGQVQVDPQNQDQHDELNAKLEASKQETAEAKSDVIPLDGDSGAGIGIGSSVGSGFVPATSLEIQGGTIVVGDKVTKILGDGVAMKVIAMRQNEAGAREVACEWAVDSVTNAETFAASALKKI